MPNATVRADARALPEAPESRSRAREAFNAAFLDVRAELLLEPSSSKQQKEIAACDLLLDRLANLDNREEAR